MESETNTAPIWVLLGKWHGDNQQLLAIAEAMQLPYRTIQLRFNRASRLPPALLGASRLSWNSEVPLAPPWPRLVLAAGRRSVPAARWIRCKSAGSTRLVHVNRPWAPLSWFDLIISTPQYALPERPNVVSNLMPFLPPPSDRSPAASLPSDAAAMPRPWTAVLVGGNSQPHVLSDAIAASLANAVNEHVRKAGGSAWVLDSPRTPATAMGVIEKGLEVPSHIVHWREGKKVYSALLGLADRFIVTEDSASMMTEALLSGRPVTLFKLESRPKWRRRFASAWRVAAERDPSSMTARCFEVAVDLGLLTAVRDLRLLHRALEKADMFGGAGQPVERAERERHATLARIAALIKAP
ncbi:MAG: ELM1/GtrOC1 family putative glycosyltransferase [Pseudomonadota bacterium]|nr:ELM1/GtrOC1 family putative glycosyltransferase [Pseudomonadota bacterium]